MKRDHTTVIGLKRYTVRVVEHQPQWATLFQAELDFLVKETGDLIIEIHHIGSTAVPGLPAKPILDIAAIVQSKDDIPSIILRLIPHGYIDRGDSGQDGGYLLVKDSQPDVRTIHLHIIEITDEQWRDYLKFRDILRGNAALREEYAALKQNLAKMHAQNRGLYTSSKNEFIQNVLNMGGDSEITTQNCITI